MGKRAEGDPTIAQWKLAGDGRCRGQRPLRNCFLLKPGGSRIIARVVAGTKIRGHAARVRKLLLHSGFVRRSLARGGPRRDHAVHAGIGDHLSEVLVQIGDDHEKNFAMRSFVPAEDFRLLG